MVIAHEKMGIFFFLIKESCFKISLKYWSNVMLLFGCGFQL